MSITDTNGALTTPIGGTVDGRPSGAQRRVRRRRGAAPSRGGAATALIVAGTATRTNMLLAEALSRRGYASAIAAAGRKALAGPGDVVFGRLDVLETLDGIEPGLGMLAQLERAGASLVNGPLALLAAHDKLLTAAMLERAGVAHPITIHVTEARVPLSLEPPYVGKPRFGTWGRDVVLCESPRALRSHLSGLWHRSWFRRHGALVQEFVQTDAPDLRLVVAGGRVVGAVERWPAPGEWRTNVALGAVRRPIEPPREARTTAVRAAAALRLDFAGVDLLRDARGRYVVIEVNGAVDFTHEYALNGNDVFDDAVDALAPSTRGARPAVAALTTA